MILLTFLPIIITLTALRLMERAFERYDRQVFDPYEPQDSRPHYNRRNGDSK